MTKNHCNDKKSIFRVFLGYEVNNSKNVRDQDHADENLLRSGITDFTPVLELAHQIHTHSHIYIIK